MSVVTVISVPILVLGNSKKSLSYLTVQFRFLLIFVIIWYETPIESSELGIYKFDAWTNSDVILDPSEITGKFMVINDDSQNVAMRLLHTS